MNSSIQLIQKAVWAAMVGAGFEITGFWMAEPVDIKEGVASVLPVGKWQLLKVQVSSPTMRTQLVAQTLLDGVVSGMGFTLASLVMPSPVAVVAPSVLDPGNWQRFDLAIAVPLPYLPAAS